MKSRILHTIQNSSQLKATHMLVNYAYSVIKWDDFVLVPEEGQDPMIVHDNHWMPNPSSGVFSQLPVKAYNLNQVELNVYGLFGHNRELINRFILPLKFAPNGWTLVDGTYALVENIPTVKFPVTLMLRFDKIINYPSIQIEMNNINESYSDAYFIEVPKLIFDTGIGTTQFNHFIERIELDNELYDDDNPGIIPGSGGDDYEPIVVEPGWED